MKFNPYIALAAAVVGAVAVDQVLKQTEDGNTKPQRKKYARLGVGAAALTASWFYGDKTTKALLLGLGVGSLATQVPVVQEKLISPVERRYFLPKA